MTVDQVRQAVTAAAQKYGVNPALALAVAERESALGQHAHPSVDGAVGIMQLMPATARGLGVDPYNDQQNIDGGVRLLSQLLRQYHGDQLAAAAAYNWGSGNLASGRPMPTETVNYVSWIAAKLGIDSGPSSPAGAASAGPALQEWLDSARGSDSLPGPVVAALVVGGAAALWMAFA